MNEKEERKKRERIRRKKKKKAGAKKKHCRVEEGKRGRERKLWAEKVGKN